MKYLDCVEILVEKEAYAKEGVHKGMQGVIWLEECINGEWDVCFPQCGEKEDIAEIGVREEDMRVIPVMCAAENERIKAEWGE
ncbi:MAG: hypothetical protein IJN04_07495 [Clostridia bacterium]|nr:hypothetical protein [Clostridia bacterium]